MRSESIWKEKELYITFKSIKNIYALARDLKHRFLLYNQIKYTPFSKGCSAYSFRRNNIKGSKVYLKGRDN